MRVLVGSIAHESNTFSPLPTTWEEFRTSYGPDVLRDPGWGSLPGIVRTLTREGLELVPSIATSALPGGVVERRAYEEIEKALVESARGVDGVCLFTHGAMRAEGQDYADAALLAALRAALGPGVPVVVALDLHGNVTRSMLDSADALVAYRTAPHVDTFETGERAARLLLRILREGVRPAMGFAKLPILMPGEMAQTAFEPMASLMGLLGETDALPRVLSSSYLKSHCWADVPDQGVAVVVVTDGDAALAQRQADRLAEAFWSRRREFTCGAETYSVDEAVLAAMRASEPTVFISDSGDNPGAGGTTDVPFVVERLLALGAPSALVAAIWDAGSVTACAEAGVGAPITLDLGGKVDTAHGKPLRVTGRVRLLAGGVARPAPPAVGSEGAAEFAVVAVEGVDVLLSRRRASIVDPKQLAALGLDALDYRIFVVKRGYLEPGQQAIAPRSILALSPGATNCDVTRLEYRRVRRPIYPLDTSATWSP